MIDIQAGDIVVCVDNGRNRFGYTPSVLRLGAVYRVTRVMVSPPSLVDAGAVGLSLAGIANPPRKLGYNASRFRKVTKADEGFSTWMHSLRPVKAREDA